MNTIKKMRNEREMAKKSKEEVKKFMSFLEESEVKRRMQINICGVPGRGYEQEEALHSLATLIQEARCAEERESVFAHIGMAAGFANGICRAGLVQISELEEIIEMLNVVGMDRLKELDAKNVSLFGRITKKVIV